MRKWLVSVLTMFVFVMVLAISIGILIGMIAALISLPLWLGILIFICGGLIESAILVFWVNTDSASDFIYNKIGKLLKLQEWE